MKVKSSKVVASDYIGYLVRKDGERCVSGCSVKVREEKDALVPLHPG